MISKKREARGRESAVAGRGRGGVERSGAEKNGEEGRGRGVERRKGVECAVIRTAIASNSYEAASVIPCRAARKPAISVDRRSSV